MSSYRSAESRPPAWPAALRIGEGQSAGRASWQPRSGQRGWAWAGRQHGWSEWRREPAQRGPQGGARGSRAWQAARHSEWHWSRWPSREPGGPGEDGGGGRGGRGGVAGARRASGCWQREAWSWDDYIVTKGSTIRVELSGAELGDADLADLVWHLDCIMPRCVERTDGKYTLNIDLSCNLYISDDGIADHLAPFLERWPVCHRLKLYKTSIGDGALDALSTWAAGGHARELHLSDLGGQVTADGVYGFLRAVHRKGKYPYWSPEGACCALWLRLEHNAVSNTDKLVSRALAEGMSLCVLRKEDLGQVRPGTSGSLAAKDVPAVNLVLFHKQELRVCRKWIGSMQPMASVSPELQAVVRARNGASAADPFGEGRLHAPDFWQQFLGPSQRGRGAAAGRSEPEGEDTAAEAGGAPGAILACLGGGGQVPGRWRGERRRTASPEVEVPRLLRAAEKLCGAGCTEPGSTDLSRTLSSPATPSDTTSSGSSADPAALEGSAQFGGKLEREDSTDEATGPLVAGHVAPPPVHALVAACCA